MITSRTSSPGTVVAIVVTHNRLTHLERCLELLAAQTRAPDEIIVFDNASDDETAAFLEQRNGHVSVILSEQNVGGAGGFNQAIHEAWSRGHDWFWLMDDDSAPTEAALERLLDVLPGRDPAPTILASRVLWPGDDTLHPMNQPLPKLDPVDLPPSAEAGLMPLRATSFVSCLMHRGAVDRHGLPDADYFIWNDDLEFTARVLRRETGYWVTASVVYHETPDPHVVSDAAASKFYFEVRNKLYMLRGRAWGPIERLRWTKALIVHTASFLKNQRFSGEAVSAVARGLRDGLGRRS